MRDLTGQARKLGEYPFALGGLADIWKGEWTPDSGRTVLVAVKLIRGTWNDPEYLARLKKKLMREGTVWSRLSHPQITPFFGICYGLDRPGVPSLVCPYYQHGDITTYLQTHLEANRLNLAAQAAAGLSYLHELQPNLVIHGDIKASNILINDRLEASLTDFGLSRILESSGFTTKNVNGTCRWMAYELIAPSEDDDDSDEEYIPLTVATDIWAFAMTVIEIFTGRIPFHHIKYDSSVTLSIMRGFFPPRRTCPEISDEIWSILPLCWAMNPSHRPTMRLVGLIFDILCLRTLSVADVREIVELLHQHASPSQPQTRNLTLVEPDGWSWSRRDATLAPYPCRWHSCSQGFSSLSECQAHEVNHFEYWKLGA